MKSTGSVSALITAVIAALMIISPNISQAASYPAEATREFAMEPAPIVDECPVQKPAADCLSTVVNKSAKARFVTLKPEDDQPQSYQASDSSAALLEDLIEKDPAR